MPPLCVAVEWGVFGMARLIDAESPQNSIFVSDSVIEQMKRIPTVDAVPRALFDDLLKHLCETCMYYLYGHCARCRWNEYRKEGKDNAPG